MESTAPVSNVFSTRADIPAGSAGDIYGKLQSTVDSVLFDQDTNTPDAFGIPLVMVGNQVQKFVGGDATTIKGALVRTDPDRDELDGSPNVEHVHGRILRGGFLAPIKIGTPARDGKVYIRTVADTGKLIGDLEATEAAGENIEIPNWSFVLEGKDANNIGVVRIGA